MAENVDNKEETKDTDTKNKSKIMRFFLWKDRVKSMADKQEEHRQKQKKKKEKEQKKKEEENENP